MIRVIRQVRDEENVNLVGAKIATLHNNEAWAHTISAETDDIKQYVQDNEAELTQLILANGAKDSRLTAKLRTLQANRLLKQSPLEGRTPEQVKQYILNNVTDQASARTMMGEIGYQLALIYQALAYVLDAVENGN